MLEPVGAASRAVLSSSTLYVLNIYDHVFSDSQVLTALRYRQDLAIICDLLQAATGTGMCQSLQHTWEVIWEGAGCYKCLR